MVYINPIEILELQKEHVNSIDTNAIRKAKRKLFAEIDLSDNGLLNYYEQKLTKSDCERAIDELEDSNKFEFYFHLASNIELNSFLANGNNEFLIKAKQESIYKLPEFINFISPYFTIKIDNLLLKSFQNKDLDLFSSSLRFNYLIAQHDLNNAFRSLSNEIEQRIIETDKLNTEIKDGETEFTDENIESILDIIVDKFPIEYLNKLPIYFQSQINKIAASINYLQLNIWNEFDTTLVSLKLLEHLLALNIESVKKPTFENNYEIVKKKHFEIIERNKNAPLLKKWANVLISIQRHVEQVENKSIKSSEVFSKIIESFQLNELNNLPAFANEVRTQIGYSIRSLSIACWNKQSDIKSALDLINFALKIQIANDDLIKFNQDKAELEQLEKKYQGVLTCYFCGINVPDEKSSFSTTIYKETYRTYFPRRVQYSYSDVKIPRCTSCQEIHSKGNGQYYLVFFGLLCLGVIIGSATEGQHFIIGGIIGAIAGWIIGKIVENKQVNKGGIKDTSDSTLANHPLLKERIKSGWTFSKPTA